MSTIRKHLMMGCTALGLAFGAVAAHADEGRHGFAEKMQEMQAKRAEHFAARQAKLHALLKLTPAQETAWTTYQAAIKPAQLTPPERGAVAAMPAPERMEKMVALAKTHVSTMEAHLAALKTFYATLTPEQQKVFDANVMGGEHCAMHRMKH